MNKTHQLQCAVVIATKNRLELLSQRAIPSVFKQTRQPDFLIVVDDSDSDVRGANESIINSLQLPACRVVYLENSHTAGASGGWDTAIDYLFGIITDPSLLYLAFLDDDDSWMPAYLERCLEVVANQKLDMVAAGIFRKEHINDNGFRQYAPEVLKAEDFLVGNPGIQGSNLFLNLSSLLAAGSFDESLSSSTDRDLCIRLADLGCLRYQAIKSILVSHFAEVDRLRLSTPTSKAKRNGLDAFWRKYASRMSVDQQMSFRKRSKLLFNWQPSPKLTVEENFKRNSDKEGEALVLGSLLDCKNLNELDAIVGEDAKCKKPILTPVDCRPFPLLVGVITSDPPILRPLLEGLLTLSRCSAISRLIVTVLDNGSDQTQLEFLISSFRKAGLEVVLISRIQQISDASKGAFGSMFTLTANEQVEIAKARTMVQRYVGELQRDDASSVVWLLDDDMRIDSRAVEYIKWLPKMAELEIDVLIGQYEGSSPNPPINGIRVQLVDMYHNLLWLQQLAPEALLPDRSAENSAFREQYPDYYYDLSRKHAGHLEKPYWIEPVTLTETVREAYARLLSGAVAMLSGFPLTRPIVTEGPSDPIAALKNSVNRGGNTFVFNHEALTETPNTTPISNGKEARRSDMIWAIVNRYYRQLNIQAVSFPVHHVGRVLVTPHLNIEKVQSEIKGSALYAGLTEFLLYKPKHRLNFDDADIRELSRLTERHVFIRLRLLEQSFHRISGLQNTIRNIAKQGELDELLTYLDSWFTADNFKIIRDGVSKNFNNTVVNFLRSLKKTTEDYAMGSVNIGFIKAQLESTGEASQVFASGSRDVCTKLTLNTVHSDI